VLGDGSYDRVDVVDVLHRHFEQRRLMKECRPTFEWAKMWLAAFGSAT
jgi:hypothetical protein